MPSLLAKDPGADLDIILQKPEDEEEDRFEIGDLKRISLMSWLMMLFFTLMANMFFLFNTFSTDLLVSRYNFTFEKAKNVVAAIPLVCLVCIPLVSFLVGRIGKKGWCMLIASLVSVSTIVGCMMISEDN